MPTAGRIDRHALPTVIALVICMFIIPIGCRTLDVTEHWREPNWSFSRRVANIAVLRPIAPKSARESALIDAAKPLIWSAEMLSLSLPKETPGAEDCVDALREAISSYLETSGLHAIDFTDTDRALADQSELMAVGADYILHTTISKWGRGYFILQSWVRVELQCQLVRAADGVVVWDGAVETTRATGILQMAKAAGSVLYSTPVAGIPYAPISAVTGPLSRMRGTVYYDLLRDSARNLTNHICPNLLEPCGCDLCKHGKGSGLLAKLFSGSGEDTNNSETLAIQALVVGSEDSVTKKKVIFFEGDRVEVIALAPKDANVSFDFGNHHRAIPMVRGGAVDRAEYRDYALFRGIHVIDQNDTEELRPVSDELFIRVYAALTNRVGPPIEHLIEPILVRRGTSPPLGDNLKK